MMISKRSVAGTVLRLRCKTCGNVFPHFSFSGDMDADTAGLCAASGCNQNDVVIVEAEPDEWNDFVGGGSLAIERRLAQQFCRSDLRVLHLIRIEREVAAAAGLSFLDFKKDYRPPRLVYSCACCAEGESRVVEELTVSDFQKAGGRIFVTGRLLLKE